jgi:DNA-binding NtrC family response regulator
MMAAVEAGATTHPGGEGPAFPSEASASSALSAAGDGPPAPGPASITIALGASAADVERELIRRTLEMTGGNKTKAARILGLSLKTIHNKAKKYGL